LVPKVLHPNLDVAPPTLSIFCKIQVSEMNGLLL